MKKRKSQMNLEVIMVLFIFLILVGIGFGIKGKMDQSSFETKVSEQERTSSVVVAQKISFLPELVCTSNGIIENNCFDLLKIKSLSEILRYEGDSGGGNQQDGGSGLSNDKTGEEITVDNYYETFGYGNITFKIIYPQEYGNLEIEDYQNITVYEYGKKKNEKYYFDTSYKTHVPITIYNPLTNENYLGWLIIESWGYN